MFSFWLKTKSDSQESLDEESGLKQNFPRKFISNCRANFAFGTMFSIRTRYCIVAKTFFRNTVYYVY